MTDEDFIVKLFGLGLELPIEQETYLDIIESHLKNSLPECQELADYADFEFSNVFGG